MESGYSVFDWYFYSPLWFDLVHLIAGLLLYFGGFSLQVVYIYLYISGVPYHPGSLASGVHVRVRGSRMKVPVRVAYGPQQSSIISGNGMIRIKINTPSMPANYITVIIVRAGQWTSHHFY